MAKKAKAKKPAAKKKAAPKSAPKQAAPRPSDGAPQTEVMRVPTDAQIKSGVKELGEARSLSRSTAGDVGTLMKELKDKKGFEKWALSTAEGLKNLKNPQKRRTRIIHLLKYLEALDLIKDAEAQDEMFSDQEDEDEGDDEQAGTPAGEKDVRPRHLKAVEGEQDTFAQAAAPLKTGTHG